MFWLTFLHQIFSMHMIAIQKCSMQIWAIQKCLLQMWMMKSEYDFNPLMLVFIGKHSLSTIRWVPHLPCFQSFLSILSSFHVDQISNLQWKGSYPTIKIYFACDIYFFVFQGGLYVAFLMDNYAAKWSTLVIGFIECIVLAWVYGHKRFGANIKSMISSTPSFLWTILWKFVAPVIILVRIFDRIGILELVVVVVNMYRICPDPYQLQPQLFSE